MCNCFILKEIESKKDAKHYYKIGFRVYKNGIKFHWQFISERFFYLLKNNCPIVKHIVSCFSDVYFMKVVD